MIVREQATALRSTLMRRLIHPLASPLDEHRHDNALVRKGMRQVLCSALVVRSVARPPLSQFSRGVAVHQPFLNQNRSVSSRRSSRMVTGRSSTRRKSVSLVMKSVHSACKAVTAWRASGVFKPVAARRRAVSSQI